MNDFSQLLTDRSPAIVAQWVEAVAQSRQISSADGLSLSAIRDHIDLVLSALASVLSQNQESNLAQIAVASICHGKLRANQGFDPAEIAKEYHLLRLTIRNALHSDLLAGSTVAAVRAITMIDEVVDAAVASCFESYMVERTEEMVKIQQQLNLTVKELTRLVKVSQDNLSMLAHELKSPLAAIMGYAELFLRQQQVKQRDTMAGYESIERIIRAGQRLLHLINDTLELSRTSDGAIQIHPAQTSVTELLESTIEIMLPLATDQKLELVLELDPALKTVVTDSIKLQQVLINLIGNAIQYTQAGRILVTSRLLGSDQWSVSVADTGIGIAPDEQLKIFDPFVRASSEVEFQRAPSSGLGLAIVDRLLHLLQGKIFVASQVGEGSTFTIILPVTLTLCEQKVLTVLTE